ncbi:MAG: DUF309 domain-containing protein [Candidatus Neomarinimicrobiota bacterium]
MAKPDPADLPVEDEAAEAFFAKGLAAFNAGDYYDAHEQWEDLWREFRLPDADFVQGLIQLAVGCFHLTNDNLNGARGLFAKTLPKLEAYEPAQRGLDVTAMVRFVKGAREQVHSISRCADFDWSGVPQLGLQGPV